MRIALAQIDQYDDPQRNLETVREGILRAGAAGADLVVFPEATMKAFNTGRLDTVAEELDGPFASAVRAAAEEADVVAVLGMFRPADSVERDGKELARVHNTLLVAGRGIDEHYDKIRLFDAFGFRESDTVAPGDRHVVVEVPVGASGTGLGGDGVRRVARVGLGTCFDVRFPQHFLRLAQMGAEVLVLPASWNDGPGKLRQWRALTAARALDTTCFVAAVDAARPGGSAKAGKPEGPTGIGHSAVVGPDGAIVAEAGYAPQFLVVDVDLDEVARVRREIPVLDLLGSDPEVDGGIGEGGARP
ncbi:nitrilase-related carbon-nitrogen hydrolase [Corynebacterium sp. 335C]